MWSAKVTTGLPDDDIAGDHIATLTAVDPNNSDLLTAKKALLNLVNQQFELLPNFADLWTPEGKKNKEIIFALCFNKNELTNWGANWFYNVALFTNATDLDGNKYGPDPLKLLTAGPLRYEYKSAVLSRFMIRKILVWMLLSFNICSKERLVALVGKN